MPFYKDHEYWTYIVASVTGTVYVGMTNDLFTRALQHKAGEIEGFSRTYHCTRLVYYEGYQSVLKAIGREKQLKGWRRSKKIALIESKNPRWVDFAEHWGKEILLPNQSMKEVDAAAKRRIKLGTKTGSERK